MSAISFQSVLRTTEGIEEPMGVQKLNKQQKELDVILERYSGVFQEVSGLPPKRETVHRIELRGVGEPISVRPYRYPHHHKDEIERQV